MHKSISIVIPTLNEEAYIGSLLKDLEKQTLQPIEIIVVDAGSTDKTKLIAKSFTSVTFITGKKGVARQRNKGGENAKGDIIYFIDADVRLEKSFLEKSLRSFTKKKLEIACPRYIPFKSTIEITLIYHFFNILFFLGQLIIPSGAGSCIIIKNNIFRKGKGFNSAYVFDDIELIRRYAKKYIFGMLSDSVFVSDRRFRKEGTIQTFIKYLQLSFFFLTNNFKQANTIEYTFGRYKK